MSEKKQTFLISHSVKIKMEGPAGIYNPDLQLNVLSLTDQTPLVSAGSAVPTHSKTFAAPGDDDPDPGNDSCY
jgi:hypothetical protein